MRLLNNAALETGLDYILREAFPAIARLPAEVWENILPTVQNKFRNFMSYSITACSVLGMPWAESLLVLDRIVGDEAQPPNRNYSHWQL
jgi:hypothetical protein